MVATQKYKVEAQIARCYGLKHIENLGWIGAEESLTTAKLRADGKDFIIRLYTDMALVKFHTELMRRLESVGVNVEQVLPAASGKAYAVLTTGHIVTVFVRYRDPTMSIPFKEDDTRAWGRFVARMHTACQRWHPSVQVRAYLLQKSPQVILRQAMSFAAQIAHCRAILERFGTGIIAGCQRLLEDTAAFQPVHGDLWPGNLLKGSAGLRAIDFRESGDGPRAIDLATAFRWMPWSEDATLADALWRTWLAGYREVREPSEIEISSVSSLACLQQLRWLFAEASEASKGVPGYGAVSCYVEDHCANIEVLLSRAGQRL